MPDFRIELDSESGGSVATVTGKLSSDDMRAMSRRVWHAEGFDGCYVLWDMRKASFDLSAEEVQELARYAAERSTLRQDARLAFVLSGDVEYGLARMMSNLRTGDGVDVLASRDFDEALQWVRQAPAAVTLRQARAHGG